MEYIPSSSSQVRQYAYDEDKHDLYIHFHGGGHYVYHHVTAEDYEEFHSAPSHGKHLNSVIKPEKTFTRIG